MKKPKKPPEKQFLESFRAHLKIAKSRGLFTKEAIEQNLGKGRACPFYTCSSKASYENIMIFVFGIGKILVDVKNVLQGFTLFSI